MPDFWRHSGFHLLDVNEQGYLRVTDDYLRAYFARPEVAPVAESCPQEHALFAALMKNPRLTVTDAELTQIADPDARDNYRIVLRFRDLLVKAGTVEVCYLSLFRSADGSARDFSTSGLPPLFVDQMAQVILRNLLDGIEDGLLARSAELLFREQRVHANDGRIVLADEETVELQATRARDGSQFGSIGRLLSEAQTTLRPVELDVLDRDNSDLYWSRDERHDTAFQINFGRAGLEALCEVLQRWVKHFFGFEVAVAPLRSVDNVRMRWFCGLDRHSTSMLNDLYNGALKTPDYEQSNRVLALMSLTFRDASVALPELAGEPVYIALSMDESHQLRLKPQNLLINLPLRTVH